MAGAAGTVAGVRLDEAAEGEPVPAALVAVTVNVYAVPAVRPAVMVQVVRRSTCRPPMQAQRQVTPQQQYREIVSLLFTP